MLPLSGNKRLECTELCAFIDLVGEDRAIKALSSFSVKRNPDVGNFFHNDAVLIILFSAEEKRLRPEYRLILSIHFDSPMKLAANSVKDFT